MTVTFHLSLDIFDDGDFDTRQDYYKSDEEYFDTVQKEVDKYSNVAYDVVSNLGNISKGKTAGFTSHQYNQSQKEYPSYKAENVKVIGDNGEEETVDGLITKCVGQDVVIYKLEFDATNIDAEFEEDYLNWVGDHNSLSQYVDMLGEEKVWTNEPVRTYKVEFTNDAGEQKFVEFERCKIIETSRSNVYTCVILVEKINFS